MAVFPILKSEPLVQVDDQIRLSATGTFATRDSDPIVKVEINPDTPAGFNPLDLDAEGYVDVSDDDPARRYLDWAYSTPGQKTVTLRVQTADPDDEFLPVGQFVKTIKVNVITEAEDALFSNDDDLLTLEPDIMKWLPEGYSSWDHIHRLAKRYILDQFNALGISGYGASELAGRDQVRRLARLTVLRMIFGTMSNQVGDIFEKKSSDYAAQERIAASRNSLQFDEDGDGVIEEGESVNLRTGRLIRR